VCVDLWLTFTIISDFLRLKKETQNDRISSGFKLEENVRKDEEHCGELLLICVIKEKIRSPIECSHLSSGAKLIKKKETYRERARKKRVGAMSVLSYIRCGTCTLQEDVVRAIEICTVTMS
jgi:hypothetical protein